MEHGKTYQHRYYPERFTCTLIDFTQKGVKVQQTETYPDRPGKKPKVTQAHYSDAEVKELWVPLNI